MKIRRALLSVSDKTGIAELARDLVALGVEIVSTGGTAAALGEAGIAATPLSEITGFPEILGGRVKTLHPAVHGGLLAVRTDPGHTAELARHGIRLIDLVAVNLYPFEAALAAHSAPPGGADLGAMIEEIDIGGVTLLRAAAKNFDGVVVLSAPAQYRPVVDEVRRTGTVSRETRLDLARDAFARTAAYDAAIARYLGGQGGPRRAEAGRDVLAHGIPGQRASWLRRRHRPSSGYAIGPGTGIGDGPFPPHLILAFEKVEDLRYGENPHQRGAFYRDSRIGPAIDAREPGIGPGPGSVSGSATRYPSVASARQLAGKALSYNNIFDLDAALDLVRQFADPAAVIVKHGIPCGVGTGESPHAAYLRAREGDPMSAFGGIVALNRPVDRATADALGETFLEAVIAPAFAEDALAALTRKKNLRLMEVGPVGPARDAPSTTPGTHRRQGAAGGAEAPGASPEALPELDFRRVRGGLLVQDRDDLDLVEGDLRVVTSRAPTEREWADLRFAWTVCRYVRSNAVVFARDRQVVGVGAGQMNRVEPVRLAARQAGERARGAVMASEAFFPFPDAVAVAIEAGITAVIQPGGSVRDAEVIAAAEAAGVAMVTTGIRHFRH